MQCPDCGFQMSPFDSTCPRCDRFGKPQTQAAHAPPLQANTSPQPLTPVSPPHIASRSVIPVNLMRLTLATAIMATVCIGQLIHLVGFLPSNETPGHLIVRYLMLTGPWVILGWLYKNLKAQIGVDLGICLLAGGICALALWRLGIPALSVHVEPRDFYEVELPVKYQLGLIYFPILYTVLIATLTGWLFVARNQTLNQSVNQVNSSRP